MKLTFGDPLPKIPVGYARDLVKSILARQPHLADDMNSLIAVVNNLKQYEVRVDTCTKYARLFKSNNL